MKAAFLLGKFPLAFGLFYLWLFAASSSSWCIEIFAPDEKTMEGLTLIAGENYGRASQLFNDLIKQSPRNYYYHFFRGESLRKMNRYAESWREYDQASKLNPTLPDPWHWLGVCYDKLGDHKDALLAYKREIALAAAQALTNYVPGEVIAKEQPDGSLTITFQLLTFFAAAGEREKQTHVQAAVQAVHENFSLTDIVVIVSGPSGRPSDTAVEQVRRGLERIPREYRETLLLKGYKVKVAARTTDADPSTKMEAPRGWPPGSTFENLDGFFNPRLKAIIIGEQYLDIHTGKQDISKRLADVVEHEFGHAYDYFLKEAGSTASSSGTAFEIAYKQDESAVRDDLKSELAYFLQKNGAGNSELFAELFPLIYGPEPASHLARAKFFQAFPNTLKLMKAEVMPSPERFKDAIKNYGDPATHKLQVGK